MKPTPTPSAGKIIQKDVQIGSPLIMALTLAFLAVTLGVFIGSRL